MSNFSQLKEVSALSERRKPEKTIRGTQANAAKTTALRISEIIMTTTTTMTSDIVPTPVAGKRKNGAHHIRSRQNRKDSRSSNFSSSSSSTLLTSSHNTRLRHQPKLVRTYGLLNRCSNKYVRVTGKHVDARANRTDRYGKYAEEVATHPPFRRGGSQ